MPAIRFGRVDTSLGPTWVAETDAGVAAVSRTDSLVGFIAPLRRRFPGSEIVADDIDVSWIDGGPLPAVDLDGLAAFDRHVYEAVRAIPPGQTMTYGDVAVAIGSPRAARAVGNAMARCPLFPAVPCHRVVRASDGWSGWGGDTAVKRRLLLGERDTTGP
jgi:AraC family transcriptional regulator, regulatory protein of adaptative response / methylated-DNA-[protein]-cysteine methyltransferase